MAARATKIISGILGALFIFLVGIASGVMLTQVDPKNPNLSWVGDVHFHKDNDCKQ